MKGTIREAAGARADAVDHLIRRRFSGCETLPLFPEPPARRRGFFEPSPIGCQAFMFDNRQRLARSDEAAGGR